MALLPLGAVYIDLVAVESFVLRRRYTDPGAVRALGHGVSYAAQIEQHTLCLGRDDARADAPFRVDFGVLFALLVEHRGFAIFHGRDRGGCKRLLCLQCLLRLPRCLRLRGLRRLRDCRKSRQHRQKSALQNCGLHRTLLIMRSSLLRIDTNRERSRGQSAPFDVIACIPETCWSGVPRTSRNAGLIRITVNPGGLDRIAPCQNDSFIPSCIWRGVLFWLVMTPKHGLADLE
jgi:hypothetical protein